MLRSPDAGAVGALASFRINSIPLAFHLVQGREVPGEIRVQQCLVFNRVLTVKLMIALATKSLTSDDLLSLGPFAGFQVICIRYDTQLLKFYGCAAPVDAKMFAVTAKNVPSVRCLQPGYGGLESGRTVHALYPRCAVTFVAFSPRDDYSKSPCFRSDDLRCLRVGYLLAR